MDSWDHYQKLVLSRLDDNVNELSVIDKRLRNIEIELAMLKVKASIWGAMAGMIPAIGIALYELLKGA